MSYKLELRSDLGVRPATDDGLLEVGRAQGWSKRIEDEIRRVLTLALAASPRPPIRTVDPLTIEIGPEFYFGRPIAARVGHSKVIIAQVYWVKDGPIELASGAVSLWSPPTP